MRRHTIVETPVGPMTLVADGPAASAGDAVLDQPADCSEPSAREGGNVRRTRVS